MVEYIYMNGNCQKCNEETDELRTLWMACFYEMGELEIPFKMEIIPDARDREGYANQNHQFYTLKVCKDCRAEWMTTIKIWWDAPLKKEKSCGSGIYIRRNGATIEVIEEEFDKLYPGHIAVRVIKDE